ncbi:MAG: tryptophan-rich sensory protein [Armatimonadetes bacterium]|nr:tryptophan-rich sensory protein [Armatimonadota bacterium]
MSSGLALVVSITIAIAAGALGGIATSKVIPTWYAGLKKPAWNPPSWVFGPVWTVLYIMMAVAAWLVWERSGLTGLAPVFYFVQLGLNVLWSFIFFGMRKPGPAFAELVVFWLAILATMVAFWQIDPIAGLLLAPYLLWVGFAGVLNFTIWRLNG